MSDEDNVVRVNFRGEHIAENELVQAIKDVVYSFEGRMTTASAFGCIEIAKHDLTEELLN